mmetsp:Transcript_15537/g.42933  ORF Transcript_15537/g.42933 Transcript_15537/m.42933 type:complete len:115 (-) Transcript_15537:150-494(-)
MCTSSPLRQPRQPPSPPCWRRWDWVASITRECVRMCMCRYMCACVNFQKPCKATTNQNKNRAQEKETHQTTSTLPESTCGAPRALKTEEGPGAVHAFAEGYEEECNMTQNKGER